MSKPTTMRLLNGEGPEVTVPDWWESPTPTPEQWVDWFLEQSREAQLVIAQMHLEIEAKFTERRAVEDFIHGVDRD